MNDQAICTDVTGIILAGGRSIRMGGRDKARLIVDGQSLFDRVLGAFRQIFAQVCIAGDRPDLAREDLPCVPDIYPGSALGGLHAGLSAAKTPYIFAAACDMPFIDIEAIQAVLSRRAGCDVVVPRTPMGFEPLFAVYSKECLPYMEQMLRRGRFRIFDLFDQVRVCYLEPGELAGDWRRTMLNINTPEQLEDLDGQ